MRQHKLTCLTAAIFLIGAASLPAHGADEGQRLCAYEVRVKAALPVIPSTPIANGDMIVGGFSHSIVADPTYSDAREARERAGELAQICADKAWASSSKPPECGGTVPGELDAWVERWAIANLKRAAIDTLCTKAQAMGISRDEYLRNVTVYLYKTSTSDRSSSCSFGRGSTQSRYYEFAKHFAVNCVSRAIPNGIHGQWTRWFNYSLAQLENHVRDYCRTNFGFENVVIEKTERNPQTNNIRGKYSCTRR